MAWKRALCLALLLCLAAALLPGPGQRARAAGKYTITVDLSNQIVTVYRSGNLTEAGIVRQMICSTGKAGSGTPTGTYSLPSKRYSAERREWYYFPKYNCYAKWATRIVGGILFHSVLYTAAKTGPTRASVSALGSRASHGCVRLRVADARWIALNCPAGTVCRIFGGAKVNAGLRRRLLARSFTGGETYDHFLGRDGGDGDTLGRGSRGDRVRQLQRRLKALGFLNDTADGAFGARTEAAVKRFQAALGQSQTGRVDDALWRQIFSEGAPTGTEVPLARGSGGPAVTALQRALAVLKLYDGAADGSYGAITAQAVRDYQSLFGFTVNGKAAPAVQRDILSRAAAVKARFGNSDYQLVFHDEQVAMARVRGSSQVTLWSKARTGSTALARLKRGAEVEVLSRAKRWSRVRWEGRTGYLLNRYLTFFRVARRTASYEPVTGPEPTAEPTATPEVSLPTPTPTPVVFIPTPSPTPEVFIPTATPTPEVYLPLD